MRAISGDSDMYHQSTGVQQQRRRRGDCQLCEDGSLRYVSLSITNQFFHASVYLE